MWWRFLIVLISFLLIGAHYLRSAHYLATIICCIVPFSLFLMSRKINIFLEYTLYLLAFVVWAISGFNFILQRLDNGQDWVRLFCIMLAVFMFTLYSGFCIRKIKTKR